MADWLANILVGVFFFVILYLWNRFLIPHVYDLNLRWNALISPQRVAWLRDHRAQIIRTVQWFFWIGGGGAIAALLFFS